MSSVLTRVDDLRSGRTPFVLATVVRAERPTSAKPGDRALVLPDGSMEGFVGGTCAESTVRRQGLRLLATGESTLLRITPDAEAETVSEGLVTVGNPCLSGGSLDIFLEAMLPPTLVHVHGDAPVARALVDIGRAVGHDVRSPSLADGLPADLPDGPVVVQVRDAHRRPEVLAFLASLAGEGRSVVVVEWGWPGAYDVGLARICARGSSGPGVAAVVDRLREAGWTR